MPSTGCKCQNSCIAWLLEDVDRLWKEKNIFASLTLVDWPLNIEPVTETQPVPGFYASAWARNVRVYLCSFGQSEDCHK